MRRTLLERRALGTKRGRSGRAAPHGRDAGPRGVEVSAAVTFGGQSDAALAAFIKLKPGVTLTGPEISRALKDLIPAYMIPARYEFVAAFPLNQSGKIDKKALAERL